MIERVFDWMVFLVVVFFLVPALVYFATRMRRSVQKNLPGARTTPGQASRAGGHYSGRQGAIKRLRVVPAPDTDSKPVIGQESESVALGSISGDYVNFAVRNNFYEVMEFKD